MLQSRSYTCSMLVGWPGEETGTQDKRSKNGRKSHLSDDEKQKGKKKFCNIRGG